MELSKVVVMTVVILLSIKLAKLEDEDSEAATSEDSSQTKYVVGHDALAMLYNVIAKDCENIRTEIRPAQNMTTEIGNAFFEPKFVTQPVFTQLTVLCKRTKVLLDEAIIHSVPEPTPLEPRSNRSEEPITCPPPLCDQDATDVSRDNAREKDCNREKIIQIEKTHECVALYIVLFIILAVTSAAVGHYLWKRSLATRSNELSSTRSQSQVLSIPAVLENCVITSEHVQDKYV